MRKMGFTLIELVVAIVILLLFTGGGILTMNNFNDKQKALGVRSEIKSMLDLTRNYASTMQYAADAAPGVSPVYYKFNITDFNGKISLEYSNDDLGNFDKNDRNWANQGVTISGDLTICYEPFEAVQYDCGVGSTATKTISVNRGGVSYSLEIDPYGKISEINP